MARKSGEQFWPFDQHKNQLWFVCILNNRLADSCYGNILQSVAGQSLLAIGGWSAASLSAFWLYSLTCLQIHIFPPSSPLPPAYLSSGASSWFCAACRWSPAPASCRSCWWGVDAEWVWGPESGKLADLQRTSGYLSYLMHMYSTHTNTNTHTHIYTEEWKSTDCLSLGSIRRHLTLMTKRTFLAVVYAVNVVWPASAGWTGPDPVRFFTGRAGTLREGRNNDFFDRCKHLMALESDLLTSNIHSGSYLHP